MYQVRQDPWGQAWCARGVSAGDCHCCPVWCHHWLPSLHQPYPTPALLPGGEGSMQLHSQALIRALHKQMAGLCWKDSTMDLTNFFMASLRASAGTPHRGPVLILHCPVHFWHLRSPSVNPSTTVVSRDLVLLGLVSTCAGRSPFEGTGGCTPAQG